MAGYKNNSSSNAHERQRTADQIYLCGKIQSSFFHAVFVCANIAVTSSGSVMSG
jgi:hypothetical protein